MTTSFLTLRDGDVIYLDAITGHHRPAHVIDLRSVVAINAHPMSGGLESESQKSNPVEGASARGAGL